MNLKDLSSVKLSKLTSEYTDQLKCLECLLVSAPAQAERDSGAGSPVRVVRAAEIPQAPKSEVRTQQRNRYEGDDLTRINCKYFIAPATASCGHTLCHTCWRGRRTCPLCASTLDRKLLKLNLPLQNLTNHTQTLGEAFEKLFKIQLDEFSLDTPGDLEPDKDPVKNVKDWLTSSQNHFSAPIQNSETFSQESQQPHNPLEISASNIIIHTDVKKNVSPPKVTKIAHVPPPQDDWDKIETMPDVEINPKHKENIVGPMDIEPFFVNENEYTTNNPRRSSRKRDLKHDDANQQIQDRGASKHTSMESSFENDKKSQKSKQTWNSVKKMRKEFSKLNKKNRGKLNVSIEMFKKAQNVKPISNTPIIATQQVDAIDENTPDNIDKEKDIQILNSNNPNHNNQDTNTSKVSNETGNDKLILTQSKSGDNSVSNSKITQDVNVNDGNCVIRKDMSLKGLDSDIIKNNILKEEVRMPFLKKSALCPKIVEVTHDKEPCTNKPSDICDHETITSSSDDIEISIKIGSTITNIVIKKKNDIQVKINTDREVQTSLGPHDLGNNQVSSKDKKDKSLHNIDINIGDSNNQRDQININRSMKIQEVPKIDKSTSEKKNTASAETATAQFEITESVEKELSNVMEYETAEEQKETSESVNNVSKIQHDAVPQIQENLENLDELNDLDIFSGSVKEANVHILKENAPSEILISTVCSKLKTQKHAEKRNRENTEDEMLPKNKKVKVTSQHKVKDKSTLPDSEPINYDAIMGQVFASIDADMEDIRKSQESQNIVIPDETVTNLKNKDLSQAQKTQIIAHCSTQKPKQNVPEFNEKNSENIFTTLEKDVHSEGNKNIKIPQQVQELLTPVLCQNIDSSQESLEDSQRKIKSNKKSQEFDDSDRSVVEETPQKDLSFPKAKRTSTSNLSQISLSETKKLPSKVSDQNIKSIIVLTDTVRESSDSNKDISIVEPFGKKHTMETPLTITKFADHIIHKSTPMARKSLNFDNENEDNDPEQTLCPTTDVIAKTTQEKEFMAKAFENTPTTPMARPQMNKIVTKPNKNYCLVASRLTSEEIMKVKLLCAHQKWRYVDSYSKDITHLVVSVDNENKSQRSVKYMCALADSKWIVSFAWIERCLRSRTVADEELFEALDSFGEPGPQRSRIATQKLFQGINFYCMPPFSVLDVVTLKNILTAAGGRVVKEIKEVRVTKDCCQPALLLAEPENTQEDRFIYLAMEHSIVPINFEWVLNCLGSYTLGSIQDLLLCPSALLPEATARWPEVLLAQEFE